MIDIPTAEDSIAIGRQAAEIAAEALEDLGRALIRQKALDVARQIEIYLQFREFTSLDDIRHDAGLSSLAVTKIGRSGYTVVHDTHARNLFHHDPAVIGRDLHRLAYVYPQFWQIVERGLSEEADGYYDWPGPGGQIERKYMYCAPIFPRQIAPDGLVVAATIAVDEYLQPSREIRERIITLAERVDAYNRAEQRRIDRLRSINRLSRRISSYLNVDELLPYVTKTISEAFEIDCVRIFLAAGATGELSLAAQFSEMPCQEDSDLYPFLGLCYAETVALTGKHYLSSEDAVAMSPARADPPGQADLQGQMSGESGECRPVRMIVPIKLGRSILGVLDLVNGRGRTFSDMDLFSIWPLADQVGTALETARLHNELRELAVVDERNRIAREIHDTLAQGFAGISMLTETARKALADDRHEQVDDILSRIRMLAKEKLSEARRSVQDLRPNITIQENLEALIRAELTQLAKDTPIETQFDVTGEEQPVPHGIKLAVVRICQEALHNIQKYAQAGRVHVALTYSPAAVALLVEDNGIGFNTLAPSANSFGLSVMRERARLVGGTAAVESQVGRGTKIRVDIPL